MTDKTDTTLERIALALEIISGSLIAFGISEYGAGFRNVVEAFSPRVEPESQAELESRPQESK